MFVCIDCCWKRLHKDRRTDATVKDRECIATFTFEIPMGEFRNEFHLLSINVQRKVTIRVSDQHLIRQTDLAIPLRTQLQNRTSPQTSSSQRTLSEEDRP
jgi:hypothetical protein